MMENGLSRGEVLALLDANLNDDIPFDSGRILGSMCTSPHSLASEVFVRYIEKNIGDPGLCASTEKREQEAVNMLAKLLSLEGGAGHIVTGGTEANILALWTARKLWKKNPALEPEVICGESAHFSLDKAADMLGLRLVKLPLDGRHRLDPERARKAVTAQTIAIACVAGSTSLGAVDPIEELSALALEKGLYLHVDAAMGGFVLPFLESLGYPSPLFDFRLAGVSSMTIDPHKMGMSVIPGGGIIYRTKALAETINVAVPYLSGGESARSTIVGTRSGASVLATWALLMHLGKRGYRSIVGRCMELTHSLSAKIKSIEGFDVVTEPTINVLGVRSTNTGIENLASSLRKLGWAISLFSSHIRVVCMPHVLAEHIERFTDDCRSLAYR
jgi:tyrosine decarboxylase/aspartate 1-decarboxylase